MVFGCKKPNSSTRIGSQKSIIGASLLRKYRVSNLLGTDVTFETNILEHFYYFIVLYIMCMRRREVQRFSNIFHTLFFSLSLLQVS